MFYSPARLRGKKYVNCFILYPKGRVSLIQEQQMTTVPDHNVHCLRVEGTFDDCQVSLPYQHVCVVVVLGNSPFFPK